ncbi:MAG: SURF1 family protein [Beijerinckiaceae bacterium]
MNATGGAHRAGWRGLILPGLVTLVAFAILVSLGAWQLRRLAWKEGIIARMQARIHEAPRPLPARDVWAKLQVPDFEYLRVTARGVYEHEYETYVFDGGGGAVHGPGWLVLTPLRLPDGGRIIVNRGFVPMDLQDPAKRAAGQIAGETQVTGLLRAPEPRNPFTPADKPDTRVMFVKEPAGIAARFKLEGVAPFLIDADATPLPGGWPKGGQTTMSIPNNHFSYALTWFGLAITLLVVFSVFAARRLRGE